MRDARRELRLVFPAGCTSPDEQRFALECAIEEGDRVRELADPFAPGLCQADRLVAFTRAQRRRERGGDSV